MDTPYFAIYTLYSGSDMVRAKRVSGKSPYWSTFKGKVNKRKCISAKTASQYYFEGCYFNIILKEHSFNVNFKVFIKQFE